MRVWLDDERPMPEHYDVHVKTPWDCIELLKTNEVVEISLDNDLGLFNYEPPNEGRHVAQFIEEGAFNGTLKKIPHLRVHTANEVAKWEIKAALRNARRFWEERDNEECSQHNRQDAGSDSG